MKKVTVVYDDTTVASSRIRTIIGKKSFGSIVLKRKTQLLRLKEILAESGINLKIKVIRKSESFCRLQNGVEEGIFLHLLSISGVVNREEFLNFVKKLPYIEEDLVLKNEKSIYGAVIVGRERYLSFLKKYSESGSIDFFDMPVVDSGFFMDLSDYDNLLMYISGGFDARFFNSLQGDKYTVTKTSADKKKMKMEYSYYWLIPESMRRFMVMPYNYKEYDDRASYTMERMPMTDIAIRWTHGAINNAELKQILDKSFNFFENRERKEVNRKEFEKTADALYLEKLDSRIKKLKELPEYEQIAALIKNGTDFDNIDEIVNLYKKCYAKIKQKNKNRHPFAVIGHGDSFFANMLYSKELGFMRLIDPKGALKESDLWTNPYYDIAKLSHSVCGNYDFFNTDMYDVLVDKDMKLKLKIHFDNGRAKEIFKEYLSEHGYEYNEIRVYEASLFLSMLPLHIDNPRKVLGFILNAIEILKEVSINV